MIYLNIVKKNIMPMITIFMALKPKNLKRTLIKLGFKNTQFEKEINDWSQGQKKNVL